MNRGLAFLLLLLFLMTSSGGCGPGKAEGQPNPALQVPDVPPSDRGTRSPIPSR